MKAQKLLTHLVTLFIATLLILSSCEKEESGNSTIPILLTKEISAITKTSAISGGEITSDGNATITALGICWSTSQSPTINDSKTVNKLGGTFTSSITGLEPNTTYYVRAYATNIAGTGYGDPVSFKTLDESSVSLANLTTNEITEITKVSAVAGGTITNDGGALVTIRGLCWGTNETPTLNDSKVEEGWGDGDFTSNIIDLTPNTTYYVRAFAINKAGTSYGNIVSFKTDDFDLPSLSTVEITEIDQTTAVSGGNITANGGAPILARGICWNTSGEPTINDSKSMDGEGDGVFASNLSGLTPNTKYFVRAYATNSAGTGYGEILTLTTLAADVIVAIDVDGNVYETVAIGDQIWFAENLRTTKLNDGTDIQYVTTSAIWSTLFGPGYCWYSNDAENNGKTYGALYNWFTVNTNKICPEGWHVPSDEEWSELTTFLGSGAGTKLKATSSWSGEGNGTDDFGFGALAAGNREPWGGYRNIGAQTNWWSTTERDADRAWYRNVTAAATSVYRVGNSKQLGISVRCVKDK